MSINRYLQKILEIKFHFLLNIVYHFKYPNLSKKSQLFKSNYYEIMFIHTREPDEIERFVKEFGCITLLIRNPNINVITSNHADAEVENYNYDYIIDNNGTLDDLDNKAKEFIKEMLNGTNSL